MLYANGGFERITHEKLITVLLGPTKDGITVASSRWANHTVLGVDE